MGNQRLETCLKMPENGQNDHFQACRQWSPRVAKGFQGPRGTKSSRPDGPKAGPGVRELGGSVGPGVRAGGMIIHHIAWHSIAICMLIMINTKVLHLFPSFASSLRSAKPLSPGWDVGGKRKRAVSQISGWGWFWPPSPPSQGKRKPPIPCIAFWPTHLTHRQTNLGRIAQQMHSWNKILEFIYIF